MKNSTPEISVIMSVYNQWDKKRLEQSIRSVLAQTFREFEFIIYSDGSDPEVVKELEAYAAEDDRIVLIHNPVNCGLAYSLNTCIDVAKGAYLARMDDDDICYPERFAIQYRFLREHPEIAYVGSAAELFDEEGTWGIRQMPEHPKESDFLKYSPYIHPSIMIRRSVFLEAGEYRTGKATWRCEDYELFMRLWRLGIHGCNLQEPLLKYREDRAAYKKRRWKYRLEEVKLRYRSFREMKILLPVGWFYVIRPVLAGLVPGGVILWIKKVYHRMRG